MAGRLILIGSLILLLVCLRRRRFRQLPAEEGWFLASLLSFLTLALTSLLLVRLNFYGPQAAGAGLLMVALLAGLRRPPEGPVAASRGSAWPLVALLAACGLLYICFPTYYLLSGRDQGVYITFAVLMGKSGGLNLALPQFAELYARFGDSIQIGFPGIYDAYREGYVDTPGAVLPQFRHLLSAYAANGYALAGIEGVVRANAPIAVLGLWAFFLLLTRLTTRHWALLGTGALGLNPVMIWHARVLLTEVLSLTLLFSALFLFLLAWERRSAWLSLLAGAVLGGGFLNRIDTPLCVLVVLGAVFAARFDGAPPEGRRMATGLLVGYLLGLMLGVVDGYLYCYHYLWSLWDWGLRPLFYVNLVLLSVSAGLLLAPDKLLALFEPWFDRGMRLACLALGLWLVVGYLLLPLRPVGVGDLALRNFAVRELSWYVNPLTYLLFCFGFWSAGLARPRQIWLPLGLFSGAAIFMFTFRPAITDEHIFASRRWLGQVIPFLLLYGVLGLKRLADRLEQRRPYAGRLTVGLVCLVYLAGAGLMARAFLFTSVMHGYREGYATLDRYLQAHPHARPNLTGNGHIAAMLTYVYGHPTFLLTEKGRDKSFPRGDFAGYRYIGLDDLAPLAGTEPVQMGLSGANLARTRRRPALRMVHRFYSLTTAVLPARIRPRESPDFEVRATHGRLRTSVGRRSSRDRTLVASGKRGVLLFGPYVDLTPGTYEVCWYGSAGPEAGHTDVAYGGGNQLVQQPLQQVENGKLASIRFEVVKTLPGVEFRVFAARGARIVLARITLRRIENR